MNRTLILLTLAAPAFADDALLACRDSQDVLERLACYDRLVDLRYPREVQVEDAAGRANPDPSPPIEPPKIVETPTRVEVVQKPQPQPASDSVELFGKPSQLPTARPEINATVQEVTKSAHRKLTITLDNQQTWLQLDSNTMRLHVGDAITIRTASFDSYQLRKQSGGKSIRVRRLN